MRASAFALVAVASVAACGGARSPDAAPLGAAGIGSAPTIESRPPARPTTVARRPLGEPVALPELPPLGISVDPTTDRIEEARLRNGVRFVSVVRRGAPLAQLLFGIDRGSVDAPPGVAEIASVAIAAGDPHGLDGVFAHEHLDYLGAFVQAAAFDDGVVTGLASLPSLLPSAIDRMLPLLATPAFDDASVNLARVTMAATRARSEDARSHAGRRLFQAMFPPPQSRAAPAGKFGAADATLRAVDAAHVRAFGEAFVTAEHAYVVVAGDIEPNAMKPIVERALARLPAKARAAPPPTPLPATRSSCEHRVLLVDRPGLSQVTIAIGVGVPSPVVEDSAAVDVLGEATGGGLDARLPRKLRTDLGATYRVDALQFPSRFNGVMAIVTSVDPHRAIDALRAANDELDRLGKETLDDRELAVAKLRALHDDDGAVGTIAVRLARDLGNGLSLDMMTSRRRRIAAMTAEDVRSAADHYLAAPRRCIVVLGNIAGLTAPIEALGLGAVELDAP